MATETFAYERQSGASGTIKYRVFTAQFGDGYSQVVADGLNNKIQTWPLSFEGNMTVIQPILDFFERHAGSKSFHWLPPGQETPSLFRVDTYSLTSKGAGVYSLMAEFKQAYLEFE